MLLGQGKGCRFLDMHRFNNWFDHLFFDEALDGIDFYFFLFVVVTIGQVLMVLLLVFFLFLLNIMFMLFIVLVFAKLKIFNINIDCVYVNCLINDGMVWLSCRWDF